MADLRDTYTVEFNAQQAITMANDLGKAMKSLGDSLASMKTGGLTQLTNALQPLDPGKIQNSVKAVQGIGQLNTVVKNVAKTAPAAADLQKLVNTATALRQVSASIKNAGQGLTGIAQFISGVTTQLNAVRNNFLQLQQFFNSIQPINTTNLQNSILSLVQAISAQNLTNLKTAADNFIQSTNATFKSVYDAVRAVTRITDQMKKLSNLNISISGKDLRTQMENFFKELNMLSQLKIKKTLDTNALNQFAGNLRKFLKDVVGALTPLFQVFKDSQKAVQTSANFGKNLNQIILNINQAGAKGGATPNKQALQNIRVNVQALHKALADLKPALDSINAAQAAMNMGMVSAGNQGTKAAQSLQLSWQSVFRLFEAHVLRRAIYAFSNALRQAVRSSAELVKAIGEVQTISQKLGETGRSTGLQRSVDDLFQDARRISEIYGLAQRDVVEAGYQAISNQVQGAAESFNFLESSAKFAKAAVTSLDTSVRLLSAALQSYNLSITQVNKVAAIFFKTIELGRLRADDLANDLGRSAALASQLGVSLEELSAAFSTATVQGIKFRNAQTYINNIMLKLIKPTDVMREAFYRMGVNSGETAISVYGFIGALEKLYQVAGDSPDTLGELGRLFGTIRAIIGTTLFRNTVDLYEENLVKIRTAQESYINAYDTIIKNSGDIFLRETNKIRTYFTSFGKGLFEFTLVVTGFFGGLGNVIKRGIQFSSLLVGLIGLVKTLQAVQATYNLTLFTTASGLASTAATLKSVTLGLGLFAAAVASAVTILYPVIRQWWNASRLTEEEFQKIYKNIKDNVEKTTLFKTKLITDQITIISEVANRIFRGAAQITAEQIRIIREDAARVEDAISSMGKSFEFTIRTTKSAIDAQQASFNAFKRTLENTIATSQNLGKEFRANTSELLKNMEAIQNFAINIDRSLEAYRTSIFEASVAKLPTPERQAIFEQAGTRELVKGQQYFSAGYIKQAQKAFQAAIGYFTKSKDAYIQMVQQFSGKGRAKGFASIDVGSFIAKLRPIEFFMSQIVYRVFNAQRQVLLNQFRATWEEILDLSDRLTSEAYQETLRLVQDPTSLLRRGDPEFADQAQKELRKLGEEIKQLPDFAEQLSEGFRFGAIGLEEFSKGIDLVQKKLVDLGQEEKQILGDVTSRQSELAQTRTNAIAAARELIKTSAQLFRQRRDARDFRERFEVDRQLVELQSRFATFEQEVGYNFAAEFIQTLQSEQASLRNFLAEQAKEVSNYTSQYLREGGEEATLKEFTKLYEERFALQKQYSEIRFSDRLEDKKQAKEIKDNLVNIRQQIDSFERRNAQLRQAGILLSDQLSFMRAIEDIEVRLERARGGESFGNIMSESIEVMRQRLKLDSELQRLQKQQQDEFKAVTDNLKNLEDTTASTIDIQGELETSISTLIEAFRSESFLFGPKYRDLLAPPLTGINLPYSEAFARQGYLDKVIKESIETLDTGLAAIQSSEQDVRLRGAQDLEEYLTTILSRIDIDIEGVIRATGKKITDVTVNFRELEKIFDSITGLNVKNELKNFQELVLKTFEQPISIRERIGTLDRAQSIFRNLETKIRIAQENIPDLEIPETIPKAIRDIQEYIDYFTKFERDEGAFKLSETIADILDSLRGGAESIYEQILTDNKAAIAAIDKTSKDLLGDLIKRAETLGKTDILQLTTETGLTRLKDILTTGNEVERAALREVFATFGSTEDSILETQRSSLAVLKEIEVNTQLIRNIPGATEQPEITRAMGGKVPNRRNLSKPYGTDSVLAALTPGEFVLRREAVQSLGIPYLESLNRSGNIAKHQYGNLVDPEGFYYSKNRSTPSAFNKISDILAKDTNLTKTLEAISLQAVEKVISDDFIFAQIFFETLKDRGIRGKFFEKAFERRPKLIQRMKDIIKGTPAVKQILGERLPDWDLEISAEGTGGSSRFVDESANDLVYRLINKFNPKEQVKLDAFNFKVLKEKTSKDFPTSRFLTTNVKRVGDERKFLTIVVDNATGKIHQRLGVGQVLSEETIAKALFPDEFEETSGRKPISDRQIAVAFEDFSTRIRTRLQEIYSYDEKTKKFSFKPDANIDNAVAYVKDSLKPYVGGRRSTKDFTSLEGGELFRNLSIEELATFDTSMRNIEAELKKYTGPKNFQAGKVQKTAEILSNRALVDLLGLRFDQNNISGLLGREDPSRYFILEERPPGRYIESKALPKIEKASIPRKTILSEAGKKVPGPLDYRDFSFDDPKSNLQLLKRGISYSTVLGAPEAFKERLVYEFLRFEVPELFEQNLSRTQRLNIISGIQDELRAKFTEAGVKTSANSIVDTIESVEGNKNYLKSILARPSRLSRAGVEKVADVSRIDSLKKTKVGIIAPNKRSEALLDADLWENSSKILSDLESSTDILGPLDPTKAKVSDADFKRVVRTLKAEYGLKKMASFPRASKESIIAASIFGSYDTNTLEGRNQAYAAINRFFTGDLKQIGGRFPLAGLGAASAILGPLDIIEYIAAFISPRKISNAQRINEAILGTGLASTLIQISQKVPSVGKYVGLGGLALQSLGIITDSRIEDPELRDRIVGVLKEGAQALVTVGAGLGAASLSVGALPAAASLLFGTFLGGKADEAIKAVYGTGNLDDLAPEYRQELGATALSRNLAFAEAYFKQHGARLERELYGRELGPGAKFLPYRPYGFQEGGLVGQGLFTNQLTALYRAEKSGAISNKAAEDLVSEMATYYRRNPKGAFDLTKNFILPNTNIPFLGSNVYKKDLSLYQEFLKRGGFEGFPTPIRKSLLPTRGTKEDLINRMQGFVEKYEAKPESGFFERIKSFFGFAMGGKVPNTPNMKPMGTDSVLAALTPGEFVLRREAVQALGLPFLNALNIQRKQTGGLVEAANIVLKGTGFDFTSLVNQLGTLKPGALQRLSETLTFIDESVQANAAISPANQINLSAKIGQIQNAVDDSLAKIAPKVTEAVARGTTRATLAGKISKFPLTKAAAGPLAVLGAAAVGSEKYAETGNITQATLKGVGATAGALAGAKIGLAGGALAGSIVPGLGTGFVGGLGAIGGAIIGGALGAFGSERLGEAIDPRNFFDDKDIDYALGTEINARKIREQVKENYRQQQVEALEALTIGSMKAIGTAVQKAPEVIKKGKDLIKIAAEKLPGEKKTVDSDVRKRIEFMYGVSLKDLLIEFEKQGFAGSDPLDYIMAQVGARGYAGLGVKITEYLNKTELTKHLLDMHEVSDPNTLLSYFKAKWPAERFISETPVEFAAKYHGVKSYKELYDKLKPYFNKAAEEVPIPKSVRGTEIETLGSGVKFLQKAEGFRSGAQLEAEAAERSTARIKARTERMIERIKKRQDRVKAITDKRKERIQGFQDRRRAAYQAVEERNKAIRELYQSGAFNTTLANRSILQQRAYEKETGTAPEYIAPRDRARAKLISGGPPVVDLISTADVTSGEKLGDMINTFKRVSLEINELTKRGGISPNIPGNLQLEQRRLYEQIKYEMANTGLFSDDQAHRMLISLTRYNTGGLVSGPQALSGMGSDTVLGALTPGEFVLNRDAVDNLGLNILNGLNSGESWFNIKEKHSDKSNLYGGTRRATNIEIEQGDSEKSGNATMHVTAHDMNSTKVLNEMYTTLKRNMKSMDVKRTTLPF